MVAGRERVLVMGGGTFVGKQVAAALLAEGAAVTLVVRPGAVEKLGHLRDEVDWVEADVWNPASLKGRARRAHTVIHTVGGTKDDPATGLTFHYLNFISLRNVAEMCISDGAPHLVLVSAASAPWLPRPYLRSKREAENYLRRVGLRSTVIRAPLLYTRGKPRPLVYRLVSFTAALTLFFRRNAPLPTDVFARGVARIATGVGDGRRIYYAADLRRLNTREERRGIPRTAQPPPVQIEEPPLNEADTRPNQPIP
jgi:uncharacterized protein YbjT (DUF2867 family)